MNQKDQEVFIKRPGLDPFGGQKKKRIEIAKRWSDERDHTAIDPLVTVARNAKDDIDLRLTSIEAMGAIKDDAAVAHLKLILTDAADEPLHHACVSALEHIASAPAAMALISAWEHVNAFDAADIRDALSKMALGVTTEPLIVALGHSSEQVRVQAEQMLLQDNSRVPMLIEALKAERTRKGAASLLVKMGGSAVGPLMQVLTSADGGQCEAAGQALTQIGPPAVRPLLTACMTQPEYITWLVAMKPAVQTTFANASQGDLPLLQYLLKTPDTDLQEIAVQSLPKAGEPALACLLQIGAGDDARLAKVAQEALGTMGAAAVQGLVDALKNPDERLRRSAAEALLGIDEPVANTMKLTLTQWLSASEMPKSLVVSTSPDEVKDYATLSDAVAAAPPGAIIKLMPGEHYLKDPLVITKPLMLIGGGIDVTKVIGDEEGCVVKFDGSGPTYVVDISFLHRGQRAAAAAIASSNELSLLRCCFEGARGPQSNLDDMEYDLRSHFSGLYLFAECEAHVQQCEFIDNAGCGIAVVHKAKPTIENCVCCGSNAGIEFMGFSTGVARNNECRGNRHGIVVTDSAFPTLEQNTCRENRMNGIQYIGAGAGEAIKNHCIRNKEHGIRLDQIAMPELADNLCECNGIQGIHYATTGGEWGTPVPGKAHGNRCVDNEGAGIAITERAIPTLVNNTCAGNEVGIHYWGEGFVAGTARQNHCERNKLGGIEVSGQAHPRLENNFCHGNVAGIVIGADAEPILQNNDCQDNQRASIAKMR